MLMKTSGANRIRRCCLAAATFLAGGTVVGTCEVRLHDAFVSTSKSVVLGMFDTALVDIAEEFTADDDTGN